MRIIIIGVGGVGAMAAWRLAASGQEVIALEQFGLDHDRGSSYGDSRIVRRVYPDTLYTALMADAYALWDELQQQAVQANLPHRELFVPSGGIFCGPAENPQVRAAHEALTASSVSHEVLDAAESNQRFPAFMLHPGEIAVYEPSMGYARASHCVLTAAALARAHGAQIRELEAVAGIESGAGSGGVRVRMQSGEILTADRLLLTAGAWTNPLLASLGITLPLTVTRQAYVHLQPAQHPADFEPGRFPVWIDAQANTYGFPRLGDVPGVKIGLHDHGTATTPETVDRTVREEDREAARRYAAYRFPWLGPEVVYEKVCLYSNTPDEDFVVDAIPDLPGAYVISACSGHGFKFTPLLGQIAANLATETPAPYDLTRFRLSRFSTPA